MANTIREQIITAYQNRLKTIKLANGYTSNCGLNVFRGFKKIEEDFLPAISISAGIETVENLYNKNSIIMKIRVEALEVFDATGAESPLIASQNSEALLGDIIQCMTRQDVTASSLIDDIQYVSGGQAEVPESEHYISGAFAEFDVKYSTVTGNPYQQ